MAHDLVLSPARTAARTRGLCAAAQALALYLLTDPATAWWPASLHAIYPSLVLLAVFIPSAAIIGVAEMTPRRLIRWLGAASVALIVVGQCAVARLAPENAQQFSLPLHASLLWCATGLSVFIGHITCTAYQHAPPERYAAAFACAVRALAAGAVALLVLGIGWAIIGLALGLFGLVALQGLVDVFLTRGFAIPASILSATLTVHWVLRSPALLKTLSTTALALLSWLLPLASGLIALFLLSLPATSLAPLWATHFATALLLTTAALLVLLINCTYQDGRSFAAQPAIKRAALRLACIELLPLTGLAAWALGLRVGQYGWSTDRIAAACIIALCAVLAVGYGAAMLPGPAALRRIEKCQRIVAGAWVALSLALLTPLADPARLAVADQLARLASNRIAPAQFDFYALRSEGARWGAAALTTLSHSQGGPDAHIISIRAQAAAAPGNSPDAASPYVPAASPLWQSLTAQDITRLSDIYPVGRGLPAGVTGKSFVHMAMAPSCLSSPSDRCTLRFMRVRADGKESLILLDTRPAWAYILEEGADGHWQVEGVMNNIGNTDAFRQALREGHLTTAAHPWQDLMINGERREVTACKEGRC